MPDDKCFLILGGGGMVGSQIVRHIASDMNPQRIVIASLFQHEVRPLVHDLQRQFPEVEFVGFWGDVFVRREFANERRAALLESAARRADLYDDLFGDSGTAYRNSQLVQLILQHRPDVIVDSINTATAISYQDIYTGSIITRQRMNELLTKIDARDFNGVKSLRKPAQQAIEMLLVSQSVPQLIRHVTLLWRAMVEVGTRLYLKIGTTGTGGMGLNIPYTHSEDKPSAKLMTKTAIAFAHTGLMFLMARTPGGPIVKEIKPGAMVGYTDITCRTISEHGKPVGVFTSATEPLGNTLALRLDEGRFERLGELDMVVVDTGENGLFTKGEFEAITHLQQMEFVTPEEIASQVVLEIKGSNTGVDVIAAIDSAVMNPSYRAGFLRRSALEAIERLEKETGSHSVALGQLGPPELSKLLWEAHLMKLEHETLSGVLEHTPEELSETIYHRVQGDAKLRQTITSVGIPILAPDGKSLVRGPFIRIPEWRGADTIEVRDGDIDKWAAKGWVDLRPANFRRWQERFGKMKRSLQRLRGKGSAAITRDSYLSDGIQIGSVVGWIFNNEECGYRIK